MNEDLFVDGQDPFVDTAQQKPKRRSGRHIGCQVPWLAWVLPLVRSKEQLALALYLYRRCCLCRSDTVTVPTEGLSEIGLGRWSKYRLLLALERAGIVRIEEERGRKTIKAQLNHWPDPP
jgi:hypothetical protein